jgi:hypothetical protein
MKKSKIQSIIKPIISELIKEAEQKKYNPPDDIIVGIISLADKEIETKRGGTHASMRIHRGYPWRYNELSDNLYWRQKMPPDEYRTKVVEWLDDRGYGVKQEIDLDNLPDHDIWIHFWNDAHGRY